VLDLPDDADAAKVRRINTHRWDSLATATLVVAIESEFGIALDAQEIERLTSYEAILILLEEKAR
ncbi:MAG: acyl carrier protein, partial [Gemmatimonadaceae bacterium]